MPARHSTPAAARLRRIVVPAVIGALSTVVVVMSTTGTFAALSASITHSGTRESTGTLVMQETSGALTCLSTDATTVNTNASTCTGINHYTGATLAPGASTSRTVVIKNAGTVPANGFTLTFAPCTQSNNTEANNQSGTAVDVCDRVYLGVTVTVNGATSAVTPASVTLTAANNNGPYTLPVLAAGASASVTFSIGVGSAIGNSYMGLTATQPLTFQFTT